MNDSNHKCGVNSNTLYDVNSNTLMKKRYISVRLIETFEKVGF